MSISSIIYNNKYEWLEVRNKLYETIQKTIFKCIIDDKFEYSQMITFGLTEKQRLLLMDVIQQELFKITLNEKWADDTTFNLIYGIQGFIQGLIKTNKWKYIFKSFEPKEFAEVLFENIKWQFDDDNHMPCILEDIPKYRCSECYRVVEYLLNYKCDNC